MKKFIWEVGEKYGQLEIIEIWSVHSGIKKKGSIKFCKCKCSCGKVVEIKWNSIRYDRKQCCGCTVSEKRRKKNTVIPGTKWGMLTVQRLWYEKDTNLRKSIPYCECMCDCGKFIVAKSQQLSSGHKKSCGCMALRKNSESPNWKGCGEIGHAFFNQIKKGACRCSRTLDFTISIEYIWELFLKQNKKCALTDMDIKISRKKDKDNTASLDRIDSSKGYIEDNVQWVHKDINYMKMDLSQNRFIELCKIITEYQKNKII